MIKKSCLLLLILSISCTDRKSISGAGYFDKGEYQQAIELYTEHLKSNPDHTQTLYNRGRAYEELGKPDLATKDFEKIIRLDDKNINAYLSLAKIAYHDQRFNKVIIYAGKALELNDNSAKANFLAARGAHQLGYFDRALESYDNAITVNKDFGEAYLYRGALKISMKKVRAACEDFLAARRLDIPEAQKAFTDFCR